jgi:hypothetical protein
MYRGLRFSQYKERLLEGVVAMDRSLLNRCRTWMLKADNLAIVRQCRRQIQQEFGVTLHIHAENMLEEICAYSVRSKNRELQRLAHPIERLLMYGHVATEFNEVDLSQIPLSVAKAR